MSASLIELPGKRVTTTVKDVPAAAFIDALAKHLKKSGKIEVQNWMTFVKTSTASQNCPLDVDWVFQRAAAILRHLFIRGNVGVGSLAKAFGSKIRRGVLPNKFQEAATNNIRKLLIQFEKLGWIEHSDDKKGRRITKVGQRELNTIATQIAM